MAGKKSQLKGKSGEREACRLMQAILDKALEDSGTGKAGSRHVQRNTLQSDGGGCDLVGVPGMAIEVKRHAVLRVESWWKQAVSQAERIGGSIPVLLYRQDRGKWQARVYAKLPINCEEALSMPVDLGIKEFSEWAVEYLKARLIAEAKIMPTFIIKEPKSESFITDCV